MDVSEEPIRDTMLLSPTPPPAADLDLIPIPMSMNHFDEPIKAFDSNGTNLSSTWLCSYRSSKINCPASVLETGDEWISGGEHIHMNPQPVAQLLYQL